MYLNDREVKILILMRHAKSSWNYDVTDKERPLKARGIIDAQLVSREFKTFEIEPDWVFSSPAKRAMETCKIFLDNLEISHTKMEVIDELYDFAGQSVVSFIKSLDDGLKSVMIFGHNHAFTSISNIFGNKFIDNLPTSGLVVITFDVESWKEINNGQTKLTVFPRDLK